jgi:hypothetical protein
MSMDKADWMDPALAGVLQLLDAIKRGCPAPRASKYRLAPRLYRSSKSTPWLVIVPKQITHEKRVRKFFKTREDAEKYIHRLSMVDDFRQADWRKKTR